MRTYPFIRNVSGVALVALLTGCSGGASQTPALSGSATALGQRSASSTSRGFMQAVAGPKTLFYVSSWGTDPVVDIMSMNGEFVGQITDGMILPQGLFTDANGNLWVANLSNVLVYPHGSLSPTATLTDPVGDPVDVTVCPNGTAYVANLFNNSNSNTASIQVYLPGSTSPSGSLTYPTDFRNSFLTCDAAGNVFTAILTGDSIGDGRIIEFPLGQQDGAKDLGVTLPDPGGIKPDDAGNLLVADIVAQTISEYTESGAPTGKSIATGNPIYGIALSRDGKTVLGVNPGTVNVISWSYPAGKQKKKYTCCPRIAPPFQNIYGVAIYPAQKGI